MSSMALTSSRGSAPPTRFSTAFQPLTGALADVLGRRPRMLASLFLFALGSALCGAAQNMDMGRAIGLAADSRAQLSIRHLYSIQLKLGFRKERLC
ncbi:hypothetical protein K439DRAFT_1187593 [Ramaria rubella]|nr:hypothetical protein K439DRAFT_1187593 [Ramaria rubella]